MIHAFVDSRTRATHISCGTLVSSFDFAFFVLGLRFTAYYCRLRFPHAFALRGSPRHTTHLFALPHVVPFLFTRDRCVRLTLEHSRPRCRCTFSSDRFCRHLPLPRFATSAFSLHRYLFCCTGFTPLVFASCFLPTCVAPHFVLVYVLHTTFYMLLEPHWLDIFTSRAACATAVIAVARGCVLHSRTSHTRHAFYTCCVVFSLHAILHHSRARLRLVTSLPSTRPHLDLVLVLPLRCSSTHYTVTTHIPHTHRFAFSPSFHLQPLLPGICILCRIDFPLHAFFLVAIHFLTVSVCVLVYPFTYYLRRFAAVLRCWNTPLVFARTILSRSRLRAYAFSYRCYYRFSFSVRTSLSFYHCLILRSLLKSFTFVYTSTAAYHILTHFSFLCRTIVLPFCVSSLFLPPAGFRTRTRTPLHLHTCVFHTTALQGRLHSRTILRFASILQGLISHCHVLPLLRVCVDHACLVLSVSPLALVFSLHTYALCTRFRLFAGFTAHCVRCSSRRSPRPCLRSVCTAFVFFSFCAFGPAHFTSRTPGRRSPRIRVTHFPVGFRFTVAFPLFRYALATLFRLPLAQLPPLP